MAVGITALQRPAVGAEAPPRARPPIRSPQPRAVIAACWATMQRELIPVVFRLHRWPMTPRSVTRTSPEYSLTALTILIGAPWVLRLAATMILKLMMTLRFLRPMPLQPIAERSGTSL